MTKGLEFGLGLGILLLAGVLMAEETPPHWIAAEEKLPEGLANRYYRHTFDISQLPTSARLVAAGDGAGIDLFLDGELLFEIEPYDPLFKADLTQRLTRGKHVFAIRSRSYDSGAMFFLRVQLKFADGTTQIVSTGNDWLCSSENPPRWNELDYEVAAWKKTFARATVDDRLLIPDSRRTDIAATDNYEQWQQARGAKAGTDPATFDIAPGFEIDLVRSAQEGEDSWISLVFDPRGRAIVSQEQAGLLRMTLSKDGGSVEKTERINDDLKEVRGMTFLGRDLYVNANNAKGMYVLRGDEQGNLTKPELLFTTDGGVGHGRNDLTVGPDNKIYSIHGDSVHYLAGATNFTSPLRKTEKLPPQSDGHLLRYDPATKKIDTLVAGLRNPYGIAFNQDGEAFTYDADAEHDMGSPWYRPTRVNHLTIGSDFGWRAVTGKWPPYYPDHPDIAPFNLDIGKGSPTAVLFGTKSKFPPRYKETLFILDWTYGRILAVQCMPRGASYLCEAETFLKGRPLNVVDLDFAPDGSMFLTTGGRKTQSALYRIRYVGEAMALKSPETPTAHMQQAKKARQQRQHLESLLTEKRLSVVELALVWQQLGNLDPSVRNAARTLLEQQPLETWQGSALKEEKRLTALVALSGLTRTHDSALVPQILTRLNEIDLTDATRTERLLAAWIYHRCVVANDALEPLLAAAVRRRLGRLYPDHDYAVNEQLTFAFAHVGAEDFVEKTMQLLTAAKTQNQQLHFLFILRNTSTGWTPATRDAYFNALAQTRTYVGGEGLPKFLQLIREEALASVTDETERAQFAALLADDPGAKMAEPLPPRTFVRKWTAEEALAAVKSVRDQPNLTRGLELFTAASCSRCHRVGKHGTLVGPDLTAVSSRFGQRDLLESIIEPSKVIAENYRSLQVLTTDGKTHVGRPALGGDYRSQVLRLNTDPLQPFAVTEIDKREIEAEQTSPVSFMPVGLLDTLSAEEIRDLLTFLESGDQDLK